MSILGAAAGAIGSLFTGGLNWLSQSNENKKNREWSEKMYYQQRDDNREDWRMLTEYNDPSKQMERLAKAGLNPHLVYGSGATATASSASAPTSTPSSNQIAPKFDADILGSYFSLRQMDLQNQNLSQQNKNLSIDNKIKYEEYRQKKYQANATQFYGMSEAKLKNDILAYQVDDTRWRSLIKGIEYTIADKYGYDKAEKEISRIDESIAQIKAQILRFANENNYTQASIGNLLKQREVMDATIEKIMADTDVSYEQAYSIYQDGVRKSLENDSYYFRLGLDYYKSLDAGKYWTDDLHRAFGGQSFGGTLIKALENASSNAKTYKKYVRHPVRNRKRK